MISTLMLILCNVSCTQCLILGPQLPGQAHLNTSSASLLPFFDGSWKCVPNSCRAIVDVRDCASRSRECHRALARSRWKAIRAGGVLSALQGHGGADSRAGARAAERTCPHCSERDHGGPCHGQPSPSPNTLRQLPQQGYFGHLLPLHAGDDCLCH